MVEFLSYAANVLAFVSLYIHIGVACAFILPDFDHGNQFDMGDDCEYDSGNK